MTNPATASENAKRDYEALAGKVVLVSMVDGFTDDNASTFLHLDPPAVMRVTPYQTDHQLAGYVTDRWMDDDRLDPIYDLELLEEHPQLEGMRSFWTYGQTYDAAANPVKGLHLELAPEDLQQKYGPVVNEASPWRMG